MARLSHLRGERDLQVQVLALMGWLILSVLVVGGFVLVTMDPSATDGSRDDSVSVPVIVRVGLGVVAAVLAARLPLLVLRHRDQVATVLGLRQQYVTFSVVTTVLGGPGVLFWWWIAPLVGLAGLVALVLTLRVRTVPADRMTQRIDYLDPEAWR